jgi:hypothetical protein
MRKADAWYVKSKLETGKHTILNIAGLFSGPSAQVFLLHLMHNMSELQHSTAINYSKHCLCELHYRGYAYLKP